MPFWYDENGPVAAALVNSWSSSTWLDLITLSSVKETMIPEVLERGLAVTADMPFVEMLVDDEDAVLIELLEDAGFRRESGDVTAWMDVATVPPISPLADGYSLRSRANEASVHHFAERSGLDVENRLRQTSLYRPDLDLFVADEGGAVAAYGLFWNDPVTGVGLIEPIRTEQPYQGKGLARHIVTTGIHELAAAGSARIKVSYDADNPPAVSLYLGVGFVPETTCSLWTSTTK
jgi:predicted N-acetyltransferase YhbS